MMWTGVEWGEGRNVYKEEGEEEEHTTVQPHCSPEDFSHHILVQSVRLHLSLPPPPVYEGQFVHSTHHHNDVLTTHHQKMILSASSFSPILLRAARSTDHDGTPF